MTMPSRPLLVLLGVVVIVAGAYVLLRPPAVGVDGSSTARPGGNAQTSGQGNTVGDVKLESLERKDDASSTPSRDVKNDVTAPKFRELLPTREELRQSVAPIARGSVLGFFVGIVARYWLIGG